MREVSKSMRDLAGRELRWTQPGVMRREYELQDGGETIAALRFESAFGSRATAESPEGTWTFKRVGFWQPRVTVRAAGTDSDIASFTHSLWSAGGTLELPDGRRIRTSTNFWGSSYELKSEEGESLVRFSKVGGVLHASSRVEITPAGARLKEPPWLVPLGWYLALKMRDDAAGGGAAAAAAG